MSTPQERLAALLAEMSADELVAAKSAMAEKAREAKAAQSKEAREAAAAEIKAALDTGLDAALIGRIRELMAGPGLKRARITITADELDVDVPIGSTAGGAGERVMSYTRTGVESKRLRKAFVRFLAYVRDIDSSPFGSELTLKAVEGRSGWSAFTGLGKPGTGATLWVRDGANPADVNVNADFDKSANLADSVWRVVKEIVADAGLPTAEANRQDLDRALMDATDALYEGTIEEYLQERAVQDAVDAAE